MSDEAMIDDIAKALIDADPSMEGHHETHVAAKRPMARLVLRAAGDFVRDLKRADDRTAQLEADNARLQDEVNLWRDRCQNFAGKQELVDRINELLAEQDQLRDALEGQTNA